MRQPRRWRPILKGAVRQQAFSAVLEIADALRRPPPVPTASPLDEDERAALEFGLLTGRAGIAVFFAYLSETDLVPGAEALAWQFLEESVAGMASRRLGASLTSGICGIGWAYDHLNRHLSGARDRGDLREIDDALVTMLGDWRGPDEYDLLYGGGHLRLPSPRSGDSFGSDTHLSLSPSPSVSMTIDRRRFTGMLAGLLGASALPLYGLTVPAVTADPCDLPASLKALKPMTDGVVPITDDERRARMERAQRLMVEQGLGALLFEPGTGMDYFTGMQWGLSERPFVAVLPARGELAYICPGFEEARARERLQFSNDVRAWQEDESPYELIAGILRDRGVATGRVGVEERLRFFIADGVAQAAPALQLVSAVPVTAGCRMFKSAAELALMQRANDITMAALRVSLSSLKEGMTQHDLQGLQRQAMLRLGGSDPWVLVGFGAASAFPHGSVQPQQLKEGDIVLMDTGCAVEGYQADITKTTVFGKPTARQTEIWNLERRAQDAAFKAAQIGATCASVDAAARKVITDAGFGPGYKVPGLPHRTGHGIGMDGHEWTNFVKGNDTIIRPGMCFSDEPTIAIYGECGIRLEDCLYITEQGPRFFSPQSPAIDRPFV